MEAERTVVPMLGTGSVEFDDGPAIAAPKRLIKGGCFIFFQGYQSLGFSREEILCVGRVLFSFATRGGWISPRLRLFSSEKSIAR